MPPDTAAPARPRRPRIVLRPTGAVFGGLAHLRGDERSMHEPGVAFRARLVVEPVPGLARGAPLFEEAREHEATIRFSRGIGLPQPWADLLGIAVRVHDAYGSGRDQDLLVTSSSGRVGARRLLIPARDGFFGQWFSSVLPFRVGDRRTLMGMHALRPAAGEGTDFERLLATHAEGGLAFSFALADRAGWTRVGRVNVGERLTQEASTALTFDPWTTGPGVRPAGLLNLLRSAAYPASRRMRGAG
jgi:hypothetical protein